jgi:cytochrome oxidase Cu insertion factor (SCO1/SenC/PrrC family)
MKKNSNNSQKRLILLAVFVGLISAFAGISFWKVMQGPPQPSTATLLSLPEPRVIADFALLDDEGQPFSLKQYVEYFDPGFTGVTGPLKQLAPLTMQLGVAYRIEEHEPGSQQYNVDHSASILLMDPDGRLHGVFPAPHNPEQMAIELAGAINK